MNRRQFIALSTMAAMGARGRAQTVHGLMTGVYKRGYDNSNTGANLTETTFTQANVMAQGIQRVTSLQMQGDARGCESQPLIVPSVPMDDGTTRDIIIASSMGGSVWVWDANSYELMWEKQCATPVIGTKAIDAWLVNANWWAISTGVVDPDTSRLYVVGWTDPKGNASTAYYQMHVLNLKDGSRVCPPVPIEGTSNGQTWNKMMRKQRSSLLMTNVNGVKTVFFGCGTVQETSNGAAGWVVAFSCTSNAITATLALSTGEGAGVWQGGSSLCADSGGNLYCVTGNGGFSPPADFGESVVKIQYTGTALKVVDWWTGWTDAARDGGVTDNAKLAGTNGPTSRVNLPVNMAHMAVATTSPYSGWSDEDLGSGGMTLTPSGVLIVCGKDGVGYVVNSANMGQTTPAQIAAGTNYAQLMSPPLWLTYFPGYGTNAAPASPTALDQLWGGKTRHMHSAPVQYGNTIFVGGENSPVRAWSLLNGALTFLGQGLDVASAGVTGSPGGMPGSFMCLSANGSTPGTSVLWVLQPVGNANETVTAGYLIAYAADSATGPLLRKLWDSRDWNIQMIFDKFCPPVCSGGKLFVANYSDSIDVYALA